MVDTEETTEDHHEEDPSSTEGSKRFRHFLSSDFIQILPNLVTRSLNLVTLTEGSNRRDQQNGGGHLTFSVENILNVHKAQRQKGINQTYGVHINTNTPSRSDENTVHVNTHIKALGKLH